MVDIAVAVDVDDDAGPRHWHRCRPWMMSWAWTAHASLLDATCWAMTCKLHNSPLREQQEQILG